MPTKTWKAFERFVAKKLGGLRRGAYTGGTHGGKSDVILNGFSIECKLHASVTHGLIQTAIDEAEVQRDNEDDFAIAVVKPNGGFKHHTLVCMRIDEFARLVSDSA